MNRAGKPVRTPPKYPVRIAAAVAMILLVALVVPLGALLLPDSTNTAATEAPAEEAPTEPAPLTLQLVAIGDIMLHYPNQVVYGEQGSSVLDAYFDAIRAQVTNADVALCNIEAPFGGGAPSGYPTFNMADEMAVAVARAGFTVANTANNHLLDQGVPGIYRTVEVLRAAGLAVSGTRSQAGEPAYTLLTVKGVKVAVVSATYETTLPDDTERSLNYVAIPAELNGLVDTYTPGSQADYSTVAGRVSAARAAGANVVICFFHNGTEYTPEPNADQRALAQAVVNAGADVVFASHPHVTQPMELLMPSGGGKPVPVYWALGNYVSNQREETEIGAPSERSILASVSLTLDPQTLQISALTMNYTPLWVDWYLKGERPVHTVIAELPAEELAVNDSLKASGNLTRAQAAFTAQHQLLGEPLSWTR